MRVEDENAYRAELSGLEAQGRLRRLKHLSPNPGGDPMTYLVDGQRAINFSGNDYLGLSQHPVLKDAAQAAIERYGVGSGSSRLISGTGDLTLELEEAVAHWKGCEAALVFSSGYQANVAILQALTGPGDWIFADRLNHASLVDGCRLSGARWTRYRHLDLEHLERLLQKAPTEGRKWIVSDTVFSMDGDAPDLPALLDLAERYQALILLDEAHASGLYGEHRSGLCEATGVGSRVTLQMGTFSKALGGTGAYVAGSQLLMDLLVNRARGFIYSTAPSPPVLAAALAAIHLIQTDSRPTDALWRNVAQLNNALQATRLQFRPLSYSSFHSPIVPLIIGEEASTSALSQSLLEAGYFVHAIRPPTVPAGESRLRLSLSAAHTETQITSLIATLKEHLTSHDLKFNPV
jgi:glycine C-acetyltransferase